MWQWHAGEKKGDGPRPDWDCDLICRRGTVDPNHDAMRDFRCGFGPDDGGPVAVSRPPYPHAYEVGGVEVDVCPAWYFSGELAPLVADAFDLVDADLTITLADPAVIIDARAVILRARRSRGHG